MRWHLVGNFKDIDLQVSSSKPKAIDVMGHEIIVCRNSKGELRALKDKCPHHGKKLSHGWCEENRIVCPYHQFSFDLDTGLGSGTGIDTYPLKESNGDLLVGVKRKGLGL